MSGEPIIDEMVPFTKEDFDNAARYFASHPTTHHVVSFPAHTWIGFPFPKQGRTVLDPDAYRTLTSEVFERDGWRCRRCGRRAPLHAHHLVKRSHIRIDTLENLVSLCATTWPGEGCSCHDLVERHEIDIIGTNANGILRFRRRTTRDL